MLRAKVRKEEVLEYHSRGRKGKLEVVLSKPCLTQRDLSMAYTPGVAHVCREIEKDPHLVYEYTIKGNLVAVISNATAVLGLGDIGPLAGKPVMEGKAVLFKRFADIDVFDIEVNEKDPDKVIEIIKAIAPTFGGINLEDIKAPECFYIEEKLKELLDIPVFHDDQHGAAVITTAALLNALEIQGKDIRNIKVVMSGAGAAGIAIAKMFVATGVKKSNIIMSDINGVVYKGRTKGMNKYLEEFAVETDKRTLAEAMVGADVFVGVSVGGIVTPEMVKTMAPKPIIFALANPDPEIPYDEAKRAVPDAVVATGRSDFPNQVNNVLGFPFIFRGALDVRAKTINEKMELAAAKALADLAKEDVPESVLKAYGNIKLRFGPDYIIPKPFDPRVLLWVAPAVAKAAIESGVARKKIKDFEKYKEHLETLLSPAKEIMRWTINKAKGIKKKRIVFTEGDNEEILKAIQIIVDENIAHPVLLGRRRKIKNMLKEMGLEIEDKITLINPEKSEKLDEYAEELFKMRNRKGMTLSEAYRVLQAPNVFGAMMVRMGDAEGIITGENMFYPEAIRPLLRIIGKEKNRKIIAGLYMLVLKDKILFFADATINIEPGPEELADIAIMTADTARWFNIEPHVAMLSFSNFGSNQHPLAVKVKKAVEIVRNSRPDIEIDGEMQLDPAVVEEIRKELFPFSFLKHNANVLIFPGLEAGNIAYKILWRLGGAEAIGPILMGMAKPANVLQRGASVNEIVNLTALTVLAIAEEEA